MATIFPPGLRRVVLRPVVLVPSGQGVGTVLASACSSSLSGAELCVLWCPTFPREASLACCPPQAWPKSLHSVFSASQSSILPLPGFTAVTATSPVSSHRTRLPPHSRDIYICGFCMALRKSSKHGFRWKSPFKSCPACHPRH